MITGNMQLCRRSLCIKKVSYTLISWCYWLLTNQEYVLECVSLLSIRMGWDAYITQPCLHLMWVYYLLNNTAGLSFSLCRVSHSQTTYTVAILHKHWHYTWSMLKRIYVHMSVNQQLPGQEAILGNATSHREGLCPALYLSSTACIKETCGAAISVSRLMNVETLPLLIWVQLKTDATPANGVHVCAVVRCWII